MAEKTLVIGGGISGLLTANQLKHMSVPFTGLEKTERLGGRAVTGHHRLYRNESCEFLNRFVQTEWIAIHENAIERKKSEWQDVAGEFSKEENFYLAAPFYRTAEPFSLIVDKLASAISENFLFQHSVMEIDPSTKTVKCQDGSTLEYDRIYWCNSLASLLRVWQGDKLPLIQAMKNVEDAEGGIALDWELSAPLFTQTNTIVFPFRYKSFILKALGVQEDKRLHWMLFLREEIGDDREEIAKIVRALKRELQKEFAELKPLITNERIGYFSPLSGESQAELAQQEVLPGIFYVGSEGYPAGAEPSLRNIDRVISNCQSIADQAQLEPKSSIDISQSTIPEIAP